MLIYFYRNRYICLLLCVLFLVMAGMAAVIRGGAAEGQGELCLYIVTDEVPVDGEDGRVVYVCASSSLHAVSGGGAAALGIALEVSEGWTVEAVTPCVGADGMTITVGKNDGGVRILLDGAPPKADLLEGEDIRLLRITFIPTEEGRAPTVKLCEDGEFYFINSDGEICRHPVSVMNFSTEINDDIHFTEETTGKSDDIRFDTEPTTENETETVTDPASETETEETVSAVNTTYVGCQETPVREGEYAVRFLFRGETPVVCLRGGGALRMEITRTDVVETYADGVTEAYAGDWSICTFRGLRQEGEYLFLVYTEQEVLCISYKDGQFCEQNIRY